MMRPVQPLAEKGAVTAIVLDHEQPHQETGSGRRHGEAEPVAPAQALPGGDPEQNERHGRDEELDHTAHGAGRPIAVQNRQPIPRRSAAARCFDFQSRTSTCFSAISSSAGSLRAHLGALARLSKLIAAIAPFLASGNARERIPRDPHSLAGWGALHVLWIV
jgi:hypothetical protein